MILLLSLYSTTTPPFSFLFFFNDTATTEIYTLSLHDALPILAGDKRFGDGLILSHHGPLGVFPRKGRRAIHGGHRAAHCTQPGSARCRAINAPSYRCWPPRWGYRTPRPHG